jgi:hypothetical protein
MDPSENEVPKRFKSPYLSRNTEEVEIAGRLPHGVLFSCDSDLIVEIGQVVRPVAMVIRKYFPLSRSQTRGLE